MAKEPKDESKKSTVGVTGKNRGSTDELEILRSIIDENPGLRLRILDKLRVVKNAQSKIPPKTEEKKTDEKPK